MNINKTYNARRSPLLEVWHFSVPCAVFGPLLTNPEGLSAKVIFTVELIGVVVIIGIREQIHSRSIL